MTDVASSRSSFLDISGEDRGFKDPMSWLSKWNWNCKGSCKQVLFQYEPNTITALRVTSPILNHFNYFFFFLPVFPRTLENINIHNIPCSSKHRTTLILIIEQVLNENMITVWHVQSCLLQWIINDNEVWTINICFWMPSFGELLNPMFLFMQTLIKAPAPWHFLFLPKTWQKNWCHFKRLLLIPAWQTLWEVHLSWEAEQSSPCLPCPPGDCHPFFPSLAPDAASTEATSDGMPVKEAFCCVSGRRGEGKVKKTSFEL